MIAIAARPGTGLSALVLCALIGLMSGRAAAQGCEFSDPGLRTRPGDPGTATEVQIGLYVVDFVAIEDVEQSFVADVVFRVEWRDPRLAHTAANACNVSPDRIWTPELMSLNRREVTFIRPPEIRVAPSGDVVQVTRAYGKFSFRADIVDFPFDRQEVYFALVARYTPEEVVLAANPEMIGSTAQFSIANWRLSLRDWQSTTEYIAPSDRHLARFDVVFSAERLTGYYVWKLIIPLVLVVMMSWAVFWIDPKHVAPRVGLAATAMLTLIAYRFALASTLPPIAYLTRMDLFLVGSSVLVFGALAVAVIVSHTADSGHGERAMALNRMARWLSPVLFVAVIAFSLVL